MPHITEHAPKFSTRSVNLYARENLQKKLQQDRRTERHRRIVQNHFSRRFDGCTSSLKSNDHSNYFKLPKLWNEKSYDKNAGNKLIDLLKI